MEHEEIIEHLKTCINVFSGINVLDLGCGIMEFSVRFLKEIPETKFLTAVDDNSSQRITEYYNTSIDDFQNSYQKKIKNSWIDTKDVELSKLKFVYSSLEEFVSQSEDKYDLILLLNVYHFFF